MANKNIADHVYAPEDDDGSTQKAVKHHYVWTVNEALNLAAAADLLGFNWQVTGYRCPTNDENVTQDEFQVTVWDSLVSETLSLKPKDDASA